MILEDEQSDHDIIREAQDNLTLSQTHDKAIRDESKRCMKFLSLEQWDQADLDARSGRVSVVIDQLGQYLDQVVNDWRRNRVGVKVSPADDIATEETARIMDGLVRQIEYQSHAHTAYDYAFECMSGGNRGFVEIGLRRRRGSMKRDIQILRCPNPDAIYEDPFYVELDTWDRQWVVKTEILGRKVFKSRFGRKAKQVDFESASQQAPSWFPDSESIMIAEYWRLEETARKIQLLTKPIAITRNGKIVRTDEVYDWDYGADTIYEGKLPEGVDIATDGDGQLMEDDEPERKIVKRLLNGCEILETETWPGTYIPIIPFYGKEIWYDGKKKLFSLISRSLDAQKGANYSYSSLFERLGQQVRSPIVGVVGQFKTMRTAWMESATKPVAFLEVDPVSIGDKPAPHPERADFDPRLDQTVLATNIIKDAVRSTMGINTAILGQDTGKTKSGVAIEALQQEGDNASYNFTDNGGRGIELAGCFIVDLIPKIYAEPDLLQIRDEQQQVISVAVNQDVATMPNPPANQTDNHFLTEGRYHVVVTASPSHETLRQEGVEAVQSFLDLMDPQMRAKALPVAMRLSDKFGMHELADAVDPPKGKINPQQVMAQLQQAGQLIQTMEKTIAEYQREKEAKVPELEMQWKKACLDALVKIRQAEIAASKDADKQDADIVASHLEQVVDQAHELSLEAMKHANALELGQQQGDQAAQLQQQNQDESQPTT